MADTVFYYEMWINKAKLSLTRKMLIESVVIDEVEEGADTCTIVINDPDMVYITDKIFIENASVRVTFGFYEDTYIGSFDGYISAIDILFPDTGVPQVTLTCSDKTHKMNREKKTRTWNNTTSAKVVQQIASEYGFSCYIQQGFKFEQQESIAQDDVTDIAFLDELAGKETDLFVCDFRNNTIYYTKKGVMKQSNITISYRTGDHEIMSFAPKINTETKTKQTKEEATSEKTTTESKTTTDTDKTLDEAKASVEAPMTAKERTVGWNGNEYAEFPQGSTDVQVRDKIIPHSNYNREQSW